MHKLIFHNIIQAIDTVGRLQETLYQFIGQNYRTNYLTHMFFTQILLTYH